MSLWPSGTCGVMDVGDDDKDNIAVACDMDLGVEWLGTVYMVRRCRLTSG